MTYIVSSGTLSLYTNTTKKLHSRSPGYTHRLSILDPSLAAFYVSYNTLRLADLKSFKKCTIGCPIIVNGPRSLCISKLEN